MVSTTASPVPVASRFRAACAALVFLWLLACLFGGMALIVAMALRAPRPGALGAALAAWPVLRVLRQNPRATGRATVPAAQ